MKKSRKMRGKHTHGFGSKKKHRGKGSKGGKGMSGLKTRKRLLAAKIAPDRFKKYRLKPLEKWLSVKPLKEVNLCDLDFTKKELDLEGCKLLGKGKVLGKPTIKVSAVSKKADEKLKKAGVKLIIEAKREEKIKAEVKGEKPKIKEEVKEKKETKAEEEKEEQVIEKVENK